MSGQTLKEMVQSHHKKIRQNGLSENIKIFLIQSVNLVKIEKKSGKNNVFHKKHWVLPQDQ